MLEYSSQIEQTSAKVIFTTTQSGQIQWMLYKSAIYL